MNFNLARRSSLWLLIVLAIYAISFFYIDQPLAVYLHAKVRPGDTVYQVFYALTYFGDVFLWQILIALGLLIFSVFFYCNRKSRFATNGLFFFVAMACTYLVCAGLKDIIGRYRPEMMFQLKLYGIRGFAKGYLIHSTPSGHTARAMACATLLSMFWRRWAWFFFLIAIAVGVSRVVLSEHYFGDIFVGFYVGVVVPYWVRSLLFSSASGEK